MFQFYAQLETEMSVLYPKKINEYTIIIIIIKKKHKHKTNYFVGLYRI